MKERKETRQAKIIPRGQKFKINRSEAIRPTQARSSSAREPLASQNSVGAYQKREAPLCTCRTACRYSPAGKQSIRTNQSRHLPDKGIERGEKDESERAQEEPASRQPAQRMVWIGSEEPAEQPSGRKRHSPPLYAQRQAHQLHRRVKTRSSGGEKFGGKSAATRPATLEPSATSCGAGSSRDDAERSQGPG